MRFVHRSLRFRQVRVCCGLALKNKERNAKKSSLRIISVDRAVMDILDSESGVSVRVGVFQSLGTGDKVMENNKMRRNDGSRKIDRKQWNGSENK